MYTEVMLDLDLSNHFSNTFDICRASDFYGTASQSDQYFIYITETRASQNQQSNMPTFTVFMC